MNLKQLKQRRDELELEILRSEQSAALTEMRRILAEDYRKVVCADCEGTGEVSEGGADIESDPPYQVTCPACHGEGFLYGQVWTGKKRYDLTHNQVFPV